MNIRTVGKCLGRQMSWSTNVLVGKCLLVSVGKFLGRQMSGSANVCLSWSANVRVGKCPDPVGKCQIGKCLDRQMFGHGRRLSCRQKLVGKCRPAKVRPHYVPLPNFVLWPTLRVAQF